MRPIFAKHILHTAAKCVTKNHIKSLEISVINMGLSHFSYSLLIDYDCLLKLVECDLAVAYLPIRESYWFNYSGYQVIIVKRHV